MGVLQTLFILSMVGRDYIAGVKTVNFINTNVVGYFLWLDRSSLKVVFMSTNVVGYSFIVRQDFLDVLNLFAIHIILVDTNVIIFFMVVK